MTQALQNFLNSPRKVLFCCLGMICLSLAGNGSLLSLYGLHRESKSLKLQAVQLREKLHELDLALQQAQDPAFMERQALDRYDFADPEDLVFVFSD